MSKSAFFISETWSPPMTKGFYGIGPIEAWMEKYREDIAEVRRLWLKIHKDDSPESDDRQGAPE